MRRGDARHDAASPDIDDGDIRADTRRPGRTPLPLADGQLPDDASIDSRPPHFRQHADIRTSLAR